MSENSMDGEGQRAKGPRSKRARERKFQETNWPRPIVTFSREGTDKRV